MLVAEDNQVNQRVAVALLEKRGFNVDVASDGREAVEMADAREYAGIFMDCQMPVLDGYQATAQIRRRQGPRAHAPIIAMTAHSLKGDRERCLAAGMDDYLSKPLRDEALDDRISRWVRQGPQPDATPPDPEAVEPAPDELLESAEIDRLRDEFPPAAFQELIDVFLTQARLLIADLADAVAKHDGERARQAAHKLRGSCASLGATTLTNLCAQAEQQAATGELAGTAGVIAALEDAFAATAHALRRDARKAGTTTAPDSRPARRSQQRRHARRRSRRRPVARTTFSALVDADPSLSPTDPPRGRALGLSRSGSEYLSWGSRRPD